MLGSTGFVRILVQDLFMFYKFEENNKFFILERLFNPREIFVKRIMFF